MASTDTTAVITAAGPSANLTPIEFNGQRVITLAMMDRAHQRPEGTARKRFNDHRERLVLDLDYFKIRASEFRTHNPGVLSASAHEDITALTESGYLLLVKSFTDDLAWQVQRELVNGYFRAGKRADALPDFSDPVAAARAWADAKEAERRIAAEKAAADAELTTARPKAVACDILSESKGDRCIRDAAKDLQVPERKLIEAMISKGWLFRTPRTDGGTGELRPAAQMVSRGFAKMVPVHTDAEKTRTRDALRITNAGLTRIAALLVKWGLKKYSNDALAKVAA
jgi:phage antirepressor YoqD-like protein